jgi:branched-chain amino acid transport system substrate-binding protein
LYKVCISEVDGLKVAVICSQTGVASNETSQCIELIKIAFREVNNRKTETDKRIVPIFIDDYSSLLGARYAAEKACSENVCAIVGISWSTFSLPAAKIAQYRKIPMVMSIATSPAITRIGNYIFRVCFNDEYQGRVLSSFVRIILKAETAVIIRKTSCDYSLVLTDVFRSNFTGMGGNILKELSYSQNDINFKKMVSQLFDLSPDILFVAGHYESGLIVKEVQALGIKTVALGGDGWSGPIFQKFGGKDIEVGYYSTHWSKEMLNSVSDEFFKKYDLLDSMTVGAALAYDAVILLADAIARTENRDREEIKTALSKTRNFHGLTGTISLNKNGDPFKTVIINKIEKGRKKFFTAIHP